MDGRLSRGRHAAVASLSPLLFLRGLGAPLARLGKADRDRLLPALDLPAGAAASERAGFTLLHRALDLLGGALRILPLLHFPGHVVLHFASAVTHGPGGGTRCRAKSSFPMEIDEPIEDCTR